MKDGRYSIVFGPAGLGGIEPLTRESRFRVSLGYRFLATVLVPVALRVISGAGVVPVSGPLRSVGSDVTGLGCLDLRGQTLRRFPLRALHP